MGCMESTQEKKSSRQPQSVFHLADAQFRHIDENAQTPPATPVTHRHLSTSNNILARSSSVTNPQQSVYSFSSPFAQSGRGDAAMMDDMSPSPRGQQYSSSPFRQISWQEIQVPHPNTYKMTFLDKDRQARLLQAMRRHCSRMNQRSEACKRCPLCNLCTTHVPLCELDGHTHIQTCESAFCTLESGPACLERRIWDVEKVFKTSTPSSSSPPYISLQQFFYVMKGIWGMELTTTVALFILREVYYAYQLAQWAGMVPWRIQDPRQGDDAPMLPCCSSSVHTLIESIFTNLNGENVLLFDDETTGALRIVVQLFPQQQMSTRKCDKFRWTPMDGWLFDGEVHTLPHEFNVQKKIVIIDDIPKRKQQGEEETGHSSPSNRKKQERNGSPKSSQKKDVISTSVSTTSTATATIKTITTVKRIAKSWEGGAAALQSSKPNGVGMIKPASCALHRSRHSSIQAHQYQPRDHSNGRGAEVYGIGVETGGTSSHFALPLSVILSCVKPLLLKSPKTGSSLLRGATPLDTNTNTSAKRTFSGLLEVESEVFLSPEPSNNTFHKSMLEIGSTLSLEGDFDIHSNTRALSMQSQPSSSKKYPQRTSSVGRGNSLRKLASAMIDPKKKKSSSKELIDFPPESLDFSRNNLEGNSVLPPIIFHADFWSGVHEDVTLSAINNRNMPKNLLQLVRAAGKVLHPKNMTIQWKS